MFMHFIAGINRGMKIRVKNELKHSKFHYLYYNRFAAVFYACFLSKIVYKK
jgi:hypothetical protein